MRIAMSMPYGNDNDINRQGNIQGDIMVASALNSNIAKLRPDWILGVHKHECPVDVDIAIHYSPYCQPWPNCLNVCYLQNAFPSEHFKGGTVGVFNEHKHKFGGYIFTSERLRANCTEDGLVLPFAADTDRFKPMLPNVRMTHDLCFVGNSIRGPAINARYLAPGLKFDMVIYGNDAWGQPWCGQYMSDDMIKAFSAATHGKLPLDMEPVLYSSTKICLNAHMTEHVLYDTINLRIFSVMACGGFVISDRVDALVSEFSDFVVFSNGGADLEEKIRHWLADDAGRMLMGERGMEYVLSKHTYMHRAKDLVGWLEETCL